MIFSTFNVFELLFLSCLCVGSEGHVCLVESDWSEVYLNLSVCLVLCTFSSCTQVFDLQSLIHAVSPVISAYTCRFIANSRVYPGFFSFVEDNWLLGECC